MVITATAAAPNFSSGIFFTKTKRGKKIVGIGK
jgi:hypothetical protein